MLAIGKFKIFVPPLWWQFMRSRHDFLLKIAPNSRYQSHKYDQSHYPPPGYGIPPGSSTHHNTFTPRHQYALFLFPGKLALSFFWFSLILPIIIFLPLFDTEIPLPYFFPSISAYAISIPTYWLVSYLFYLFLYHYFMPPVLSRVWEKWPVPANHLFLSVPHQVSVYEKWNKTDEDIYWQPDEQNEMHRQTSEFAPDTQSLQEILLNFAVFEFFFKRPSGKKSDAIDTLNEKKWYLYLLTPIWLNYLLILISLLILVTLRTNLPEEPVQHCFYDSFGLFQPYCESIQQPSSNWIPIANLPYNFIPVILVWLSLSLFYITKIVKSLGEMHKKIRQGAFNADLEFVPQPILQELSNIPKPKHINAGIKHIKKILGWISGIALIGFLAILEVLAQAYGNTPTTFAIGYC